MRQTHTYIYMYIRSGKKTGPVQTGWSCAIRRRSIIPVKYCSHGGKSPDEYRRSMVTPAAYCNTYMIPEPTNVP